MSIPKAKTWVDNEVVTPQDMNAEIRDAVNFLRNVPVFKAGPAANTALTNGVWNAVTLDTTWLDNCGMSNETHPTDRFVPFSGVYRISGQARFGAGSDGNRYVGIFINGSVRIVTQSPASQGANTVVACTGLLYLTPTDVITLRVQENGTGDTLYGGGDNDTVLTVQWTAMYD